MYANEFQWFLQPFGKVKFNPLPADGSGPGPLNFSNVLDAKVTPGVWYWIVNSNQSAGTFQISTTQGGAALGPFTTNATFQCTLFRQDPGHDAGAYFLNPGYGPYFITTIKYLNDINPSLGNIYPDIGNVLTQVDNRVSGNTDGWLGENDAAPPIFTQMHLDSSIAPQ